MRVKVKVKNPQWPYRSTYARHILVSEFNIYEGELKKMRKDWRFPKDEFLLVNGDQSHIISQSDVVQAWVKRERN